MILNTNVTAGKSIKKNLNYKYGVSYVGSQVPNIRPAKLTLIL